RGLERQREAGAPAPEGAAERLPEVEQERVAELVRLALVRGIAPGPARRDGVAAWAVALAVAPPLGHRPLGDLADRLRRERPLTPSLLEVARGLQRLGEALERLGLFRGLLA